MVLNKFYMDSMPVEVQSCFQNITARSHVKMTTVKFTWDITAVRRNVGW